MVLKTSFSATSDSAEFCSAQWFKMIHDDWTGLSLVLLLMKIWLPAKMFLQDSLLIFFHKTLALTPSISSSIEQLELDLPNISTLIWKAIACLRYRLWQVLKTSQLLPYQQPKTLLVKWNRTVDMKMNQLSLLKSNNLRGKSWTLLVEKLLKQEWDSLCNDASWKFYLLCLGINYPTQLDPLHYHNMLVISKLRWSYTIIRCNVLSMALIKDCFLKTFSNQHFCDCPVTVVDSLSQTFFYCPRYAVARERFLRKWLSE